MGCSLAHLKLWLQLRPQMQRLIDPSCAEAHSFLSAKCIYSKSEVYTSCVDEMGLEGAVVMALVMPVSQWH